LTFKTVTDKAYKKQTRILAYFFLLQIPNGQDALSILLLPAIYKWEFNKQPLLEV